jgi:hypothetical protein
VARKTDDSQHFHHWELIYTEILGPFFEGQKVRPEGFDLMFGNPPWMKVTWADSTILSEINPLLGVRGAKSAQFNRDRSDLLIDAEVKINYREKFLYFSGLACFLNDVTLYPELSGVQTNLYKNFIEKSWALMSSNGIAGMLHPEGLFDDPQAGHFRGLYYERLRSRFQFRNELKLFSDVHHQKPFSINIFGARREVGFDLICNLFHPRTIDSCYFSSNMDGEVPGIKNRSGFWDIRGSKERIITIGKLELTTIRDSFEGVEVNPINAKLPQIHQKSFLGILDCFANANKKVRDFRNGIYATEMLHEANAQRDGLMTREESPTYQPKKISDLIFCGPHFYVATPFSKTVRSFPTSSQSYDTIMLDSMPIDFLPRSVYRPGSVENSQHDLVGYSDFVNHNQSGSESVSCRLIFRKMFHPANERTLIGSVVPIKAAHMNGCFSYSGLDDFDTVTIGGVASSILADFIMKLSGRVNASAEMIYGLPVLEGVFANLVAFRSARLNFLTEHYAKTWNNLLSSEKMARGADSSIAIDGAGMESWFEIGRKWTRDTSERNDYNRRKLLLEIDVILSLAMGLSVEDLCQIYNIQFPLTVLYDSTDLYDSLGTKLPNKTRKESGASEVQELLLGHDGISPLIVNWEIDNGYQTITKAFHPPFTNVDRIEDYMTAYRVFSERLGLADIKELS